VSNLMRFGIIFFGAYLLQTFLTFRQIKAFNTVFSDFRKRGKVVTGRKSGRMIAGTVILFLIDDEGVILDGSMMQGVSVFATFKPFARFNGQHLIDLNSDHEDVKSLHKITQRTIENARELYVRFLTGTMEPENYSRVTPYGINLAYLKDRFKNKRQKSV